MDFDSFFDNGNPQTRELSPSAQHPVDAPRLSPQRAPSPRVEADDDFGDFSAAVTAPTDVLNAPTGPLVELSESTSESSDTFVVQEGKSAHSRFNRDRWLRVAQRCHWTTNITIMPNDNSTGINASWGAVSQEIKKATFEELLMLLGCTRDAPEAGCKDVTETLEFSEPTIRMAFSQPVLFGPVLLSSLWRF